MRHLKVVLILALSFLFFSCKETNVTYDDEAAIASNDLSRTEENINSSEVAVQLAQLPEPEGTPILVGIDKGFWVKDRTDPTPFINIVNLFSNIYLKSDTAYGVWFYTNSGWTRREGSDSSLVRLIWVNSVSETLRLTLYADSVEGVTSNIHVVRGRIILERNGVIKFNSEFSVNGTIVDVLYQISGIASCLVHAVRSSATTTSPFVGTIQGAVKGEGSVLDTIHVFASCNADSTRDVNVIFLYKNINFIIDATVSKVQIPQSGPKYRTISGNFFANTMDIGDVTGIKYEYQDDFHKDYLRITLTSGRRLNIW